MELAEHAVRADERGGHRHVGDQPVAAHVLHELRRRAGAHLTPFAPARISAEYVCDVGVIPAARMAPYAANASRQSPAAPTACMYAVYVYAVGALRPGP